MSDLDWRTSTDQNQNSNIDIEEEIVKLQQSEIQPNVIMEEQKVEDKQQQTNQTNVTIEEEKVKNNQQPELNRVEVQMVEQRLQEQVKVKHNKQQPSQINPQIKNQQIQEKKIKVRKYPCIDEFILINKIDSGQSSNVYKAKSTADNKLYALKILNRKVSIKEIENEHKIQQTVEHPNIIKSYKICENRKCIKRGGKVKKKLNYIQLEYAFCGDFFNYIKKCGPLSKRISNFYFHQLIAALEQIHKKGYCHRDLKLANILLDEKFNLKIGDFGFAASTQELLNQYRGTQSFMAPEIQMHKSYNGTKVDIFSAGVILFIFMQAAFAFDIATVNDKYYRWVNKKNYKMFWKRHSNQWQKKFPQDFRTIIEGMLAFNPEERITIEQIKQTAFYKSEVATQEEVIKEMSKRLNTFDPKLEKERQNYISEQNNQQPNQ